VSGVLASSIFGDINAALETGLAGIAILSFYFRWIVPGAAMNDVKSERDQWKVLYEQERQAHQATIAAFTASSQRSDAGVEAAKVTIALVEALKGSNPPAGRG
jgi:hypothetical protein